MIHTSVVRSVAGFCQSVHCDMLFKTSRDKQTWSVTATDTGVSLSWPILATETPPSADNVLLVQQKVAVLKRGCQHPSNKFEILWQVAQNSLSLLLSYFVAQYVLNNNNKYANFHPEYYPTCVTSCNEFT